RAAADCYFHRACREPAPDPALFQPVGDGRRAQHCGTIMMRRFGFSLSLLEALAPLLPFAVTGALYELLRGVFRQHGPVHVRDLLALEQRFFSVPTSTGPRALSEVVAQHPHVLLDLWCGATYLLFLIEILAATLW